MIETIEKREQHLERKVKDETAKAIQLSKQNKKREALTCIKRKKMYEKQLDQLSNTKMTLESQQLTLEAMHINREAIETTKVANGAMQQNIKAMGGVDAVAETMDAVEEGMQVRGCARAHILRHAHRIVPIASHASTWTWTCPCMCAWTWTCRCAAH